MYYYYYHQYYPVLRMKSYMQCVLPITWYIDAR